MNKYIETHDELKLFLLTKDEVQAVYFEEDRLYNVVFYQDGGGSFSISLLSLTKEEFNHMKREWDNIESWYKVDNKDDFDVWRFSQGFSEIARFLRAHIEEAKTK
jgi:hypothetical protein